MPIANFSSAVITASDFFIKFSRAHSNKWTVSGLVLILNISSVAHLFLISESKGRGIGIMSKKPILLYFLFLLLHIFLKWK